MVEAMGPIKSRYHRVKTRQVLALCFTGIGAFIEVILESGYSGRVAYWLCLSAGCSEELLRSVSVQRQMAQMASYRLEPYGHHPKSKTGVSVVLPKELRRGWGKVMICM